MRSSRWTLVGVAALAVAAVAVTGAGAGRGEDQLSKINHVVVIYEENHSFDNLYGAWEGVNGLASAASHATQVAQNGTAYACLKQNDANLTSPVPLAATCTDTAHGFTSAFSNTWFSIDNYIPATAVTCPPTLRAFEFGNGLRDPGINPATGLPVPGATAGGCTRDIVHRFYHEQYQLDGGRQDRYVTGSDAIGLTMGVYDTRKLPVYRYLHEGNHPHYAILDDFFQAAFGGSFLNHQWLIAAASPFDAAGAPGGADAGRHPTLDSNGMPSAEPLYTPTTALPPDQPLTATCAQVATLPAPLNGLACGNYGVNTMQPPYYPQGAFGAVIPAQTNPTIGDRLTAKGVDWAWYSGGWSNANGNVGAPGWTNGTAAAATPTGCSDPNVDPSKRAGVPVAAWPRCPNNLFQYHHQPFNYYTAFSTATPEGLANRAAHLRDEQEFIQLAQSSTKDCNLQAVSFVKPIGQENEHPGYASEPSGSDHLVGLLKAIENGACAKDTLVIVTYDEFGGQWDHVSPPGQGNNNGPHDQWGPGTRLPALVVSPFLRGNEVVDGTQYDTTSILATIERRWDLRPLGADTRDGKVNDLSSVFAAKQYEAAG